MKNIKTILISIVGVLFVMLLLVFMVNGVQNKAIGLEEQIKTAESDIKVQEKRRVDLIYNLVDTVKKYDKHEYETLKDDGALKVNLNIKAGSLLSKVTDDKNVFTSEYNFYHLLNMKENLSKDSDFTSASLDISTDLAGDNATEDDISFTRIKW